MESDKQALPALDASHFPEQPLPFPVPETNPTVLASVPVLARKSVLLALAAQRQALVQPHHTASETALVRAVLAVVSVFPLTHRLQR